MRPNFSKWLRTSFLLLISLSFTGVFIRASSAEGLTKHPRVAELEDTLSKDGASYLRGRFPDQPFLLNVSVDPLRRVPSRTDRKTGNSEILPYLDLAEEEIQDEWDDPQSSLHQLLLRVTKVTVAVTVPKEVSDDEAAEIRASLLQSLHLIPARDSIEITRREWSKAAGAYALVYPVSALVVTIFFLLGLYVINRSGTARLSKALASPATTRSPANFSGPAPGAGGFPRTSDPARSSGHTSAKTSGMSMGGVIEIRGCFFETDPRTLRGEEFSFAFGFTRAPSLRRCLAGTTGRSGDRVFTRSAASPIRARIPSRLARSFFSPGRAYG